MLENNELEEVFLYSLGCKTINSLLRFDQKTDVRLIREARQKRCWRN